MTWVMTCGATDAARALVERHVDTFEKLTIFLALARIPAARWSLDALGAILATPPARLQPSIDQLRLSGLVRRVAGADLLELAPATPELALAARELYVACERDRAAIVELLVEIAGKRQRGRPE